MGVKLPLQNFAVSLAARGALQIASGLLTEASIKKLLKQKGKKFLEGFKSTYKKPSDIKRSIFAGAKNALSWKAGTRKELTEELKDMNRMVKNVAKGAASEGETIAFYNKVKDSITKGLKVSKRAIELYRNIKKELNKDKKDSRKKKKEEEKQDSIPETLPNNPMLEP